MMNYRGERKLRTGGMSGDAGFLTDMLLGAKDEAAFNNSSEQNVTIHVFVCPNCGDIQFVNDPRRGF
jgi:hypothetical protein